VSHAGTWGSILLLLLMASHEDVDALAMLFLWYCMAWPTIRWILLADPDRLTNLCVDQVKLGGLSWALALLSDLRRVRWSLNA
jgi:hypothetical protein